MSNSQNDKLIYGKNDLQRIVSLEVKDDELVVFQEDKDGNVLTSTSQVKFYLLSPVNWKNSMVKLGGNLHYKYGKQFSTREEFSKTVSTLRKCAIETFQIWDPVEATQTKDGYTYYKGMTHTEPSILSFDIESTGLFHKPDSKVLLISNTFRKNGQITRKLFSYDEYESDKEFLEAWCNWVREMNPSIIAGHNIYTYDFPYLKHVAELNGTSLKLGRDDSDLIIKEKPSDFRVDGSRSQEYHKVRIFGREVIDTMFLAIRYDTATKKYESYGLKNIIKQEGLEKENRVMYDAGQIRFNYTNPEEWIKIKEYCEHDADDALALYDLMAAPIFYATQSIPRSFQSVLESATGAQINGIMVRSYLQEGHSLPKASPVNNFQGAISIGIPGNYSNCLKWDVASLYPSIMRECKVYDPEKDPKGNLLKILDYFAIERLKNKKIAKETGNKYYKDLEQAQKIFANSMYGFLSTQGILFNFPEGAEFVTKTGREILTTAIEWATGKKHD